MKMPPPLIIVIFGMLAMAAILVMAARENQGDIPIITPDEQTAQQESAAEPLVQETSKPPLEKVDIPPEHSPPKQPEEPAVAEEVKKDIHQDRETFHSPHFFKPEIYQKVLRKIIEVRMKGQKDTHVPVWYLGHSAADKPQYELSILEEEDMWSDLTFRLSVYPSAKYSDTKHDTKYDFVGVYELWFKNIKDGLWAPIEPTREEQNSGDGEEIRLIFMPPPPEKESIGNSYALLWQWCPTKSGPLRKIAPKRGMFQCPCLDTRHITSFIRISSKHFKKRWKLDGLDPWNVAEDLTLLKHIYGLRF